MQRDPALIDLYSNIGFLLVRAGYLEEAIALYQRALANPHNAVAHLNLAIAYLTSGDLVAGFREYEWRWLAYGEEHAHPTMLSADLDLMGKRVCIHAEQGFGDTFMFMRYLILLKNKGAHITFIVQPALKTLLSYCPYIDTVLTFDDPVPSYDYCAMLLSLPTVYHTSLETIPADIPYLYADPALIDFWSKQTAHDLHCKVGICWHGKRYKESCTAEFLASRSCKLDYFKLLAEVPGVTLYSLQKIDGIDELETGDSAQFIHIFDLPFDENHGRFMDSVALIKNLDLVITIDTSVAHLAAALGIPTWILLPETADWRWMCARTDTPWYPNVRLFRQEVHGDWESVMQQAADELRDYVYQLHIARILTVS